MEIVENSENSRENMNKNDRNVTNISTEDVNSQISTSLDDQSGLHAQKEADNFSLVQGALLDENIASSAKKSSKYELSDSEDEVLSNKSAKDASDSQQETKNQNGAKNSKKSRKVAKILDSSDSEPELATNKPSRDIDDDSSRDSNVSFATFLKNRAVKKISKIDSDSENENNVLISRNAVQNDDDNDSLRSDNEEHFTKKKRIVRVHSDSDEEKNTEKDFLGANKNRENKSIGGSLKENGDADTIQMDRLAALCDSDSSYEGDDSNYNKNGHEENVSKAKNKKSSSRAKKEKPIKEKAPKKMTGKEAAEQKKEIYSESQRMIRETNVSLPYHKPKVRSLKEFLQNRPKFSSALPNSNIGKTPPSIAMKMSLEQLKIVSKKLEERKKEVIAFYKSETESESDNEKETNKISEEKNNDEINLAAKLDANEVVEGENIQNKDNKTTEIEENDMEINNLTKENNEETLKNDTDTILDNGSNEVNKSDNLNKELENLESANKNLEPKNLENDKNENMDMKEIIDNALDNETNTQNNDKEMLTKLEHSMEIEENMDTLQMSMEDQNLEDSISKDDKNKSIENMEKSQEINELSKENEDDTKIEKTPTILSDNENDQNIKTNTENIEEKIKSKYDLTEYELENEETQNQKIFEKSLPKVQILSNVVLKTGETEKMDLDFEETENYEFNLDDLDDEIDDLGQKNSELLVPEKQLSKKELLKKRLSQINSQPRLSGGPNEIIDFDQNITKPSEVTQLIDRFLKHTSKPGMHKKNHEMSVFSVTKGEIHKEMLEVTAIDDDSKIAIIEKPGTRIKKLRNDLENQMAQKRSEIWKEKAQSVKKTNEEKDPTYDGEKSECGADDDAYLDDEDEEDFTDEDEELFDDEDIEENDLPNKKEKLKPKNAFIDSEAEVSEDDEINEENMDNNEEENDNLDNNEDDVNEEQNKESDAESENSENENKENLDELENEDGEIPKKRILKRIVNTFDEDSDDENSNLEINNFVEKLAANNLNKSHENDSDDDVLSPNQIKNYKTPQRPSAKSPKSKYDFLTPVSYITGLQNLNSTTKNSPGISPFQMHAEPSPLKEHNWQPSLQKKLFSELSVIDETEQNNKNQPGEFSQKEKRLIPNSNVVSCSKITNSQNVNTQDLLNICSGTEFSETSQNFTSENASKILNNVSDSTQDLLNICSAQESDFSTQNQNIAKSINTETSTQDLLNICSAGFTGASFTSDNFSNFKENAENVALDEQDDEIISQLIDEDEMERFKKKFESPTIDYSQLQKNNISNSQRSQIEVKEVEATGGVIDSDDDSENNLEVKRKKKNQKKLTFSDDEDDSEDELSEKEQEEIDLQDNEDIDNIGYDSEENEIEHHEQVKKATDFFEKEAELSESEWGSEDEDERNLDEFERDEKADNENFDETELRTDIEKVQMRQMLDDDNREIKILQEMLLEDGELHGAGRERQFRWKNIDSFGDDAEKREDEAESYLDDEESEEHWRKMRHQREMFLQQKQSQESEDSILVESQSFKFSRKTVIKSQSNSQIMQNLQEKQKAPSSGDNLEIKTPFSLLSKRGSFLGRSEQVLQRLAEFTKVSSSINLGTTKTKKIVFQTVDTSTEVLSLDKKRKATSDGTPNVIKKLRLTAGFSPALNNKKNSQSKPDSSKKLFGTQ